MSSDLELLERITAEYEEMPGLSLTLDQAARLFTVERARCAWALEVLVARQVLRKRDGEYRRA